MNKKLILIIVFIFLIMWLLTIYKANTKSNINIILADLKGGKDFNNKLNSN